MTDRLDDLIARLGEAPTDRGLDGLADAVARGVGRRQAQARTTAALAPVGAVSVALALATGVAMGGVAAASMAPAASGSFSLAADLAPSTLLERMR
jgi:hypothetical protein